MAGGIEMIKYCEDLITSGLVSCQGCGATIAMRMVLRALGPKTIVVVPACCWTIISGAYPYTVFNLPMLHVAFETAASTASGISRSLKAQGKNDINILAWAGDGGTFDIGLQALSGAAERGENIIYVCYDNEAYMNTGIQRSSATPEGTWTTTTPNSGEDRPKKNMMAIMMAHDILYAATLSIAYHEDLERKVNFAKSLNGKGLRYLHVLAPCPTGWRAEPSKTIELARLAVQTGIFPLYEFSNIDDIKNVEINNIGNWPFAPVEKYLKAQGRFAHLSEGQIAKIQKEIEKKGKYLQNLRNLYQ